jgi:hypothetical protein
VRIVWLVLAVVFVFLGTVWAVDRGRRWDRPRLAAGRFESLGGPLAMPAGSRGILLVPLNPGCPHCLASWHRLMEACPGEPRCEDRVALLVDVKQRPPAALLARLRGRAVWWDRRGVWRARWGHRVYGERMRFDGSGSYLGTSPPLTP